MNTQSSATETVVRNHLQAFLDRRGIAAILGDYDDNAHFHSEKRSYRGIREIHDFFVEFMASLPAGAIERFSLRSLQVDGEIAYITWNIGDDVPLGTDTFLVRDGKIVSQTFAMYATASSVPAVGKVLGSTADWRQQCASTKVSTQDLLEVPMSEPENQLRNWTIWFQRLQVPLLGRPYSGEHQSPDMPRLFLGRLQ